MMHEIRIRGKEGYRAIAMLTNVLQGLEPDKEYTITVKEYRKKRSLEANAYFWALVDDLAERIHESKIDIYRGYIKEIGGNSDLLVIKNEGVDRFCKQWASNGTGYVTEVSPNYKYPAFSNVRAYYGSSTYDTKQMSRLIDMAVQDCKALGIPTLEDIEIDRLCREWGEL